MTTTDKPEAERLADDAEHLAGWLERRSMTEAAATTRKQAAELRRLSAVERARDELQEAMYDEIAEGLRLRELGGAGPDENITAMTERVIRERDALREEVAQLKLAEEGAAEAFGVIVQEKRDAEAECKRLNDLLQAAYTQLRNKR